MKFYFPKIAIPALLIGSLACLAFVIPKSVRQDEPEAEPGESRTSYLSQAGPAPVETVRRLKPDAKAPSAPDYDKLTKPFLNQLRKGDLIGAENTLRNLGDAIPASFKEGLLILLTSARESRKALAIAAEEKKQHKLELSMKEREKRKAMELVKIEEARVAEKKAMVQDEARQLEQKRIETEARLDQLSEKSTAKISASLEKLNQAATNALEAAHRADHSARETARMASALRSRKEGGPSLAEEKVMPSSEATTTEGREPVEVPMVDPIHFGFNSSEVPLNGIISIEKAAAELSRNPEKYRLQLRGYSDSVGNPRYNAILSRKRSQSVREALIRKGVSAEKIEIISFGSAEAPAGRRSEEHRRVDLVFVRL